MKILRIPSGYEMQIEHLPDKDVAYITKSIFALANNKEIKQENSMRFGILKSIWRECVQMENKARAKKGEKWLSEDVATLSRDIRSDKGCDQINKDQVKSNQEKSKKSNKFKKPSLSELKNYMEEKNYKDFSENFFDFYESKGWKVGKNPMKDWKSAVRGWVSRDQDLKKPEKKKVEYGVFQPF